MLRSGTGKPRLPRFSFYDAPQLSPVAALEILALWILIYLTVLISASLLFSIPGPYGFHAPGLLAAVIATGGVLFARPLLRRRARLSRSSVIGAILALMLIAATHMLLVASAHVSVTWRGAVPLAALLAAGGLICLASLHEELIFRGICFEALARISPWLAVALTSLLFALLHTYNSFVTGPALINIALGGVFLGLVRLRWGFAAAAGAHASWNIMSGVVLGHPISGWNAGSGLLRSETVQHGSWWSGGDFGLEGGLALTLILVCTILPLLRAGLQWDQCLFGSEESSPDYS